MNKFAIPALAAVIALGACAEADAPADDGTDTVVIDEPAATETVVAEPVEGEEGSSVTIDGADVDATISEDGVQANIDAN